MSKDDEMVISWDDVPMATLSTKRIKSVVEEKESEVTAGYMVSVDGQTAPRKVHATIDDAKQEAERLSKSQSGKNIRVLLLVGVYEPSHTWKEMV